MNKKTQTIATYNKSAQALAAKFDKTGTRIEDVERGFSYVHKDNPRVIEIGCGNGRDAKEILKHTSDYIGIDVSEELIKIAKENVPGARFEIADAEHFTFPEDVDIIFAFASLLHSDKNAVEDILKRAHKALNKGGIFYISLKYGDYRELTQEDEFGTRTYYFYTPEVIEELASDGYKTIYTNVDELRGQKWFQIVLSPRPAV